MAAVIYNSTKLLKQQSGGLLGIAYIRLNNYSTENVYNLSNLKRGTGGRSSFNGMVATVFGATGFTGRYVCNRLGKIGTQLVIPYRADPAEAIRLKLCGDLGQVLFTHFNLKDPESIAKAVKYSDVVINLIGRDWESRNYSFHDVHVKGARDLARICREAGVRRFIHVSTLNGSEEPPSFVIRGGSGFLKSKYQSEEAVLSEFPDATIFRPSDIFGEEDRFVRYLGGNWRRHSTVLPLYRKGDCTIKQPVCVSDFAAGIVEACQDPSSAGKIYQAVGPSRYHLGDLCDWFMALMRRDERYHRYDMRLDPFFYMKVSLTKLVSPYYPIANLHWEKVERECITDVVDPKMPTLEDLGVTLTAMEKIVPWTLRPYMAHGYYSMAAEEPFPNPDPPKPVVGL